MTSVLAALSVLADIPADDPDSTSSSGSILAVVTGVLLVAAVVGVVLLVRQYRNRER